jgi:ATP-dependent exoDNAse (exonuclease V) alpha subunit
MWNCKMPLTRRQIALARGGGIFRLNDKTMQIRNNYEKEFFNGTLAELSKLTLRARK